MSDILPVDGRFDTLYNPVKQSPRDRGLCTYTDALDNVLDTIKELKSKEARIITVVGCGGDEDKTKRPVSGKIAVQNCNKYPDCR